MPSLEAVKVNSALIKLGEATEDFETIANELKKSNVIDTDLLFAIKQRLKGVQSIVSELEALA